MVARRQRGGRQVARGPQIRAQTDWTRLGSTASVVVAAGTKVLLASFTSTEDGVTVRRTRGRVAVMSDQSAVAEEQLGAFGIVKVTTVALAAGAASIPGPITDDDDQGWMVYEPFVELSDMTPGGAAARASGPNAIIVDNKAMRKVPFGFALAVMIENASATTGLEVNFRLAVLTSSGYVAA